MKPSPAVVAVGLSLEDAWDWYLSRGKTIAQKWGFVHYILLTVKMGGSAFADPFSFCNFAPRFAKRRKELLLTSEKRISQTFLDQ